MLQIFSHILTKYTVLWYDMAKISYSKGNYNMKFNKNSYREFQNKEEAAEWG